MKATQAEDILREWDAAGRYVFTKRDLAKLFSDSSPDTFAKTLERLVRAGALVRASRGVYVYGHSRNIGPHTLEDIALVLRKGHYVFESLESALSQWGLISQIPVDRITCMTTGRSGEYRTPFGVIEFTHTQRSASDIAGQTIDRPGHAVPIASKERAIADLKRVGRNTDLLIQED